MSYQECLTCPGNICSPDPSIPTTLLSKEDRALFQLCIESACRLSDVLSNCSDAHPAQRSVLTFNEWFARPDISAAFKFHYNTAAVFDEYADQARNKVARALLVTAALESENVFQHIPVNSSNVCLLEDAVRECRLVAAKLDSTTKYARPQTRSRRKSKSRATAACDTDLHATTSHASDVAPQALVSSQSQGDSSRAADPHATTSHAAVLASQTRAPAISTTDWDPASFLKQMNQANTSLPTSKSTTQPPFSLASLVALPRADRIAMLQVLSGEPSSLFAPKERRDAATGHLAAACA